MQGTKINTRIENLFSATKIKLNYNKNNDNCISDSNSRKTSHNKNFRSVCPQQ